MCIRDRFYIKIVIVHYRFLAVLSHSLASLLRTAIGFAYAYRISFMFAVGRTLNGLGCTLGWIVGMVMCFAFPGDPLGRMFICFALVVLLVVATSFAVFHPGPLSYVREVRLEAERSARIIALEAGAGRALELSTRIVAGRYGLTPRQAEVLYCLAQGRNAGYIAEKFTISAHTAKRCV